MNDRLLIRLRSTLLVFLVVVTGGHFSISGNRLRADQTVAKDPRQDEPQVTNGMFIDKAVHCRVTQRFEIYNPHSEEHLRAIKEMGFTQVILDWPNLHEAASESGLDVVLANWWTLMSPDQSIDQGIENAKRVDRKRLVGVSMMDEPERNSPDTPFAYYQALYEELRERLDRATPGVPLEISHWGPLKSWTSARYASFIPLYQATDRIRIMPYPDLYESPLDDVYFQMMRSRHLMKLAGRELPQIVILQTWELPENPKLPSIDELRVMAYQAMLSGADTVSFFSYDPDNWRKTPDFAEGFAGLMRELTNFSQRFQSAEVETTMNDHGVLTAKLFIPGASPVTVVVNTNRESVEGLNALQVVLPPVQESSVEASRTRQPQRCCRHLRWFVFRHRRLP